MSTAINMKTKALNLFNNIYSKLGIVLKVISVILLAAFCSQLYTKFAIDDLQVLPDGQYLFINVLRWLSIVMVGICFVTPWYSHKNTKLLAMLGLVVGILNLVFMEDNFLAWGMGRADFSYINGYAYTFGRVICFIVEQIALILIGSIYILKNIKEKEFKGIRPVWFILTLLGLLVVFLPPTFLQNTNRIIEFTTSKEVAIDFSLSHIIYLAMIIVIIIGGYFLLRRKSKETCHLILLFMALASVFAYSYCGIYNQNEIYLWNIPLHLCNLGTYLLFAAFFFNRKGVFYFALFANVLGGIFAMLMPDSGQLDYWWTYNGLRFWYNHIAVVVIPVLGLILGVYKRPKLNLVLKAIGVFTVYFIVCAIANAWLSNYGEVDYFFINSDFFFEKLKVSNALKENFVWEFYIGTNVFRFYPLFHVIIYGAFIGLMFVLWYLYDFMFNVSDSHRGLHYKKKLLRENYIDFKKELAGRSVREPLYKEEVDMIEIKNFTKIYTGSDHPSVDNLSLTINNGEVYGFLGHNGAGKSTTIKSLVGIQNITSGQMIVDGFDVAKQPVEAKLRIGYVSDNHAVYERLTGREYINYIADLYMVSQEDRDARIEKYVKMFHLENAIDNEIKSYSHGMKQKIVVIASLIHDPKVWILDEPLTGLDPTSAYQIKECMREHASRGNIVFFSSHVIEVVEKICTRICIISHGKLQCDYSLKELKEKGISLEELYLKYVSSQERIH